MDHAVDTSVAVAQERTQLGQPRHRLGGSHVHTTRYINIAGLASTTNLAHRLEIHLAQRLSLSSPACLAHAHRLDPELCGARSTRRLTHVRHSQLYALRTLSR